MAAPGVLGRILAAKVGEVAGLRAGLDPQRLRAQALAAPPAMDFAAALMARPIAIIAEIKKASPSAGAIRPGLNVAGQARAYAAGGAAALSVLTDAPFFGGSLADLAAARGAVGLPILRKDFIIDPLQLHQARLAGADAALLIAAALTPSQLADLFAEARAVGLTPLIEVHAEAELGPVLALDPPLVGVNNRDLASLAVDLATAERLRRIIPDHIPVVAESGVAGPADVARLAAAGIRAFLVGTALMRSPDPALALRALAEAAR
ncbi:MAG: indole-3-glycerol phosphate synthase TrpC [Thermodesulfobacteriota bacterium]